MMDNLKDILLFFGSAVLTGFVLSGIYVLVPMFFKELREERAKQKIKDQKSNKAKNIRNKR